MLKRYLLFIGAALALSIAATVAAAAGGDDSNPPSANAVQVTAIESDAKDALAVLGQRRVTGDALPEGFAARMNANAAFGMNAALSRRAIANMTSSVYVIPARDHVCASLTDPKGVTVICPPTEDVATGKSSPATVGLETGDIAIYGIVPDGVDSVSVQTGASSSTSVETEDNAYYTVVPAGTQLRTVSYVGPSGAVEFPIYDPALAMGEDR